MITNFDIYRDADRLTTATQDFIVFNKSLSETGGNKVKKENEIPYVSKRAPMPGYYKFIIPKGAQFYYTKYHSLTYFSDNIIPVSDVPLTKEDCIKICCFPKSYQEACFRLNIIPENESMFMQPGAVSAEVALQKLRTVTKAINIQYGIDEYDFYNPLQDKWYIWRSDVTGLLSSRFVREASATVAEDAGCKTSLFLPFEFAADYLHYGGLNREFSELYKTYLQAK
jgi:hypothetical protein